MDGHRIKVDTVFRNWLVGSVDGLPYAVKVCDIASEYGIDEGRIIKLYLFAADGEREIAAYERGWMNYPALKYEDAIDALIDYCARLPNADRWVYHFAGQ